MSEIEDGRRGSRTTLHGPGFGLVPFWVIQQQPSPAAICCYVVLSGHSMGGRRTAFPSIETLMRETNLSKASVMRGLADLRERGIIKAERQKSPRGGYATTHYTVVVDERDLGQMELGATIEESCESDVAELSPREIEAQERSLNLDSDGAELRPRDVSGLTPEEREELEESGEGAIAPSVARSDSSYRNQMFTALAVAAFPAGIVPRSQRSFVGKVTTQLCGDQRDPKEVPSVMKAGRQRFDPFTIAALPKWWDELSKTNGNGRGEIDMDRLQALVDEQRRQRSAT